MNRKEYNGSEDNRNPIDFSMEDLKEAMPNLSEELEENDGKKVKMNPFDRYKPDVLDFIRRCEKDSEAKEIVEWMEDNDKIEEKKAKELKNKIENEGVRSFGSRKKWGWYAKKAREIKEEEKTDENQDY